MRITKALEEGVHSRLGTASEFTQRLRGVLPDKSLLVHHGGGEGRNRLAGLALEPAQSRARLSADVLVRVCFQGRDERLSGLFEPLSGLVRGLALTACGLLQA